MNVKEKNVYMRVYVCHIHTDTYIHTDKKEQKSLGKDFLVDGFGKIG